MSYSVKITRRFKKQYKLCLKRGLDETAFVKVFTWLTESGTLPSAYHPHKLSGNYAGAWECHIQPDWLLIWEQNDDELTLLLIATGSHADLFSKNRR